MGRKGTKSQGLPVGAGQKTIPKRHMSQLAPTPSPNGHQTPLHEAVYTGQVATPGSLAYGHINNLTGIELGFSPVGQKVGQVAQTPTSQQGQVFVDPFTLIVPQLSTMIINGPFRKCQSLSFITVHGQFKSNKLGLNCQVTI